MEIVGRSGFLKKCRLSLPPLVCPLLTLVFRPPAPHPLLPSILLSSVSGAVSSSYGGGNCCCSKTAMAAKQMAFGTWVLGHSKY